MTCTKPVYPVYIDARRNPQWYPWLNPESRGCVSQGQKDHGGGGVAREEGNRLENRVSGVSILLFSNDTQDTQGTQAADNAEEIGVHRMHGEARRIPVLPVLPGLVGPAGAAGFGRILCTDQYKKAADRRLTWLLSREACELCPSLLANLNFSSIAEAQTNGFPNGMPAPRGEPAHARALPGHAHHHSTSTTAQAARAACPANKRSAP